MRRGGVAPLRSLPEDQHHQPQETPEAWLLAQQHAERANKLQKEAAAAGGSSSSHHHHQGGQRKLMVPYLGLEVTPELVAISMGESLEVAAAVCVARVVYLSLAVAYAS